jgi:hypothetical protein
MSTGEAAQAIHESSVPDRLPQLREEQRALAILHSPPRA